MKSLRQAWGRSLPRPVGEAGRRSVGNEKELLRDCFVPRAGSLTYPNEIKKNGLDLQSMN